MTVNKLLAGGLKVPGEGNVIHDPILPESLNLSDLINFGINLLFLVAVLAALFYLIWGGISWITSGGNKEGLDKARKTIIYAIFGLIITLSSFALMNFVGSFFGVKMFGESDTKNNTPMSRDYDCPDGSNNYLCGQTYDTKCPLCSADPSCEGSPWPILECTDSSAFCITDMDCPVEARNCAPGTKAVATCNVLPNSERGHCLTHCINYSYP
jgi:hypothetical protein